MNVPLDVFHHDDRVIHYQSDREHDGQQGQQVDGETRDQHQKDGARSVKSEWPPPGSAPSASSPGKGKMTTMTISSVSVSVLSTSLMAS